jgi:hypothetical protein
LSFDESVEIDVSKPDATTLAAVSDVDVTERAGSNVPVKRLDRAVQLGGGLRSSFEPVR